MGRLADAHGKVESIPVNRFAPCDLAHFFSRGDFRADRAKREDQVVMKMIGLAFADRDAMHVDPGQRSGTGGEYRSGFLGDLAPGGVLDGRIVALDMTARQKPAIQSFVMNQKKGVTIGMKDQSGCRDVAGRELRTGKRCRRVFEQQQNQFSTLRVLGKR